MAFWSNASGSAAAIPARKYRFKMGPAGTNWWYVNSVTLPSFDINTSEYQLLNHKFKYPGVLTWNPVTINIVDTEESVKKLRNTLATQSFDFLQQEGINKTNSARIADLVRSAKADEDETKKIKKINEGAKKDLAIALEIASKNIYADENEERAEVEQDRLNRIKHAKDMTKSSKENLKVDDLNDFTIEQMGADGKTFRTWTLVNSFITSVNYGDLSYSSDDLVSIEIIVAYDYATTDK